MAKNPPRPDRPAKKRDNFFTRPKFKPNKSDKLKKNFNRPNRGNETQNLTGDQSFRPSVKGGDDFFVKPNRETLAKKSTGGSSTTNFRQEDYSPRPAKSKPTKNATGKEDKKPFDKKRYRLQKYSKKYKLEQWEQKRKKAVMRGYYRTLKEDEPKLDVEAIYQQYKEEIDDDGDNVDDKIDVENENNLNASINQASSSKNESTAPRNSKEKKNKAFKKAHMEFQRIREEKQKKKDEGLKKKAEREEALQAYKKKKAEKFKKLNRKTKRGQPIMKERIEMLLEKIQSSLT